MEQVLTELTQRNKAGLLFEYMLVAYPSPGICEELQEYIRSIGLPVEPEGTQRPVIKIARFVSAEPMEETLMRWLQRICSQQRSFILTLNNFGGLPPGSVCVRIMDPLPLKEIVEKLSVIDPFLVSNGGLPVQTDRYPQITIAHYEPEDFTNVLFEYSKNYFHGSFIVSQLVLLKKKHALDAGSRINIFSLLPMTQEPACIKN